MKLLQSRIPIIFQNTWFRLTTFSQFPLPNNFLSSLRFISFPLRKGKLIAPKGQIFLRKDTTSIDIYFLPVIVERFRLFEAR